MKFIKSIANFLDDVVDYLTDPLNNGNLAIDVFVACIAVILCLIAFILAIKWLEVMF